MSSDRCRLEPKRLSTNYKLQVGGSNVYLTLGTFPNGKLAEIFIDMNKEGSTMRALLNCIAILTSLGIQYGIPIETFVRFFSYMKFEPAGPVVGYPRILYGHSIVDVIFRLIGIEYAKLEAYADDTDNNGDTINPL